MGTWSAVGAIVLAGCAAEAVPVALRSTADAGTEAGSTFSEPAPEPATEAGPRPVPDSGRPEVAPTPAPEPAPEAGPDPLPDVAREATGTCSCHTTTGEVFWCGTRYPVYYVVETSNGFFCTPDYDHCSGDCLVYVGPDYMRKSGMFVP